MNGKKVWQSEPDRILNEIYNLLDGQNPSTITLKKIINLIDELDEKKDDLFDKEVVLNYFKEVKLNCLVEIEKQILIEQIINHK